MSAPFHFGIVCSIFNQEYTDALLASTLRGLVAGGHTSTVVRVPGAFEIPLQVQRLARAGVAAGKPYDALIALGLVWQGKTPHASEITRAVTDNLMRIGLDEDIPVIHQVLCVKTEADAKARTMGKKLNRGTEAAAAAITLAELTRSLAAPEALPKTEKI
ncbi:6,7-dimethyl-8-ribityllumazine synthase [Verrucomicrobia bacterium LW23]|nr:6,7-dimethyl-8-ribityllumazine synthase [Verrucomicrobia bacterium LW23]